MADFTPNDLIPDERLLCAIFEDGPTIGFSLVDASRGTITVGEFGDDLYYKNFRTLLAHRSVCELIIPTQLSDSLKEIIKNCVDSSAVQQLPAAKFLPNDKVDKTIRELETDSIKLDNLLTILRENQTAARAFGGLIQQLRRYQLLHEVVRTAKAECYVPPSTDSVARLARTDPSRKMVLDSMTLTNLDVIPTSDTEYGSGQGFNLGFTTVSNQS